MATAMVFGMYAVFSMIVCLVFFETKTGKRVMDWMLDKLTLK